MNEAYKNLVERRSVRKYNNKKVSHDLVEKIIYAGQCAPSGMNRQIFAFVAVEDEELVKELNANVAENSGWKQWKLGPDGYPIFIDQ